jgi:hypothetical protein
LIKDYAMKFCREVDLGTRRRCGLFHAPATFPQVNSSRYLLDRLEEVKGMKTEKGEIKRGRKRRKQRGKSKKHRE